MDQNLSEVKASILLVDDRPENLLSLQAILEPLGETLVLARSGREALRALLVEDFALILLDAEMPEMNGFEVAEAIREREKSSHVPIIFVTAHSDEKRHMFRSYSVGAVDFMPKPIEPEVLLSKVRVFVELYKKREQVKEQAERIIESEKRELERQRDEEQRAMEQEHMRQLNHELERRVEERTAELIAANQEMEAFCYSVSHDLRAPLRAISATSRMLLEDASDKLSEEESLHLQRQCSAANRLATLIDGLLLLSRLGRVKFSRQRVSLSELGESIAEEFLNREWEHPPEFAIQPDVWVEGDPALVRVAMENLIDNACKYSPDGAKVEVGLECADGVPAVYVQDHGIGFDTVYSEKLFRPFERLVQDERFEGTGIGLAIVERVVHRHGGRIWANSQLGAGSRFSFTLAPSKTPAGQIASLR